MRKPACGCAGRQLVASDDFTVHWESLTGEHTAEVVADPQQLLAC